MNTVELIIIDCQINSSYLAYNFDYLARIIGLIIGCYNSNLQKVKFRCS